MDADWASNSTDHKSQGGHDLLRYYDGGAISWLSRRQHLIAISTPKVKSIASSGASQEVGRLLQLQTDIHGSLSDTSPFPIYCYSQGALSPITTTVIKARTKQIDVCYHNSGHLHARKII
jgi:hypothetical protein